MSGCLSWKYAFASVTGTSHLAGQLPCQDASGCDVVSDADGRPILVAAASDGAGSAVRAERGSRIVCASFIRKSRQLFVEGGTLHDLTEGFARAWLADVRKEIYKEADAARLDPGDYASTFLGAVIGENEATFLHLGDGAIVVARRQDADRHSADRHSAHRYSESYRCLSWPQQGEYVNSTHFVTDEDAAEKIVLCYEAGIDEIAIFSDGIQHLVLDYEYQLAHSPFFNSLFSWLRASQEADPHGLSDSLKSYLNSPKVNERTDDDKTLILATRRPPDINLSTGHRKSFEG